MPTFVAMSSLHLLLITSLSLPLGCAAFLLPNPFNAVLQTNTSPSNPALKEYSDAQANSFITHRLNIGESGSQIRLPIDNLKVRLDISPRPEKGQDGKPPYPVPLPGTDGPNPGLSSGAMALGSANSGTFVTHEGTQHLPLSDGSWEIVWRYGNPAGSIVFGFRVTREVRRNQAILPAGRLYLSYPIWTAEGIEQARSYVSDVKGIAEMYTSERDEHLRSAENTSNPLMKALKYRQAFAAQEKVDLSGMQGLIEVPEDSDLVPMCGSNLSICKYGSVWTKDGNFFGGKHTLLGSTVVTGVEEGLSQEDLRP